MDTIRLRIETPGRHTKYKFIKIPDGCPDMYDYLAECMGWHGKKKELYFDSMWYLSCVYVVEIKRIKEKDEL